MTRTKARKLIVTRGADLRRAPEQGRNPSREARGPGAPRHAVENVSGSGRDQEAEGRGGRSRVFTAWMRERTGSTGRRADAHWGARSSRDAERQPSIRSRNGMGEGAWEGAEFRLQFGPEQGRSAGADQGVSIGRVSARENWPPISKIRSESSR